MGRLAVVAGRRVDSLDTLQPRFPVANLDRVRHELERVFVEKEITCIVSSAACGSDLIAQSLAKDRGIRRHIVIPYSVPVFKVSSVTDRPGNWGC